MQCDNKCIVTTNNVEMCSVTTIVRDCLMSIDYTACKNWLLIFLLLFISIVRKQSYHMHAHPRTRTYITYRSCITATRSHPHTHAHPHTRTYITNRSCIHATRSQPHSHAHPHTRTQHTGHARHTSSQRQALLALA